MRNKINQIPTCSHPSHRLFLSLLYSMISWTNVALHQLPLICPPSFFPFRHSTPSLFCGLGQEAGLVFIPFNINIKTLSLYLPSSNITKLHFFKPWTRNLWVKESMLVIRTSSECKKNDKNSNEKNFVGQNPLTQQGNYNDTYLEDAGLYLQERTVCYN